MSRKRSKYDKPAQYIGKHRVVQKNTGAGYEVTIDDGFYTFTLAGRLHREDGPARFYEDTFREWWLHGMQLYKGNFTDLKMVLRMQAAELFDATEILRMKNV